VADLLLVVDFDGTVYRGDEPVRYYARRVAESMHPRAAEPFLASFERYLALGVRAADSCDDTVEAAALRESYDAWGAAVHLAERIYKVAPAILDEAFVASRVHMLESGCELEPVTALFDALRDVRGRARRVLATNSPPEGLMPLLDLLGVAGLFDEVAVGLGKPDGLRRYLQYELGDDLRSRPWRLFSVGDHYRNEIEPAVEIGAGSGYIDRFGRADGPATAVAATVEGVLPTLLAWADDPSSVIQAATN
jgi:FMN phosphatase YigB (HAD superfamily)